MSTTESIGRRLIHGRHGLLTSATTPRRPRLPRCVCGETLLPAPQNTYSQERKKTMTQHAALTQEAYLLVFSKCLGKSLSQLFYFLRLILSQLMGRGIRIKKWTFFILGDITSLLEERLRSVIFVWNKSNVK